MFKLNELIHHNGNSLHDKSQGGVSAWLMLPDTQSQVEKQISYLTHQTFQYPFHWCLYKQGFLGMEQSICAVCLQQCNRSEGPSTNVTFSLSLVCVALHVAIQIGALGTGVTAHTGTCSSHLMDYIYTSSVLHNETSQQVSWSSKFNS